MVYNFIIRLRMAGRLEKLPARGGPVNQTIIINNANININYLNERTGPLSSRGLDNWNLNNNLKQFGQTRQLGFFKGRQKRNKSNSPYIIHKVRTQDIRQPNKIYATLNQTASKWHKHQSAQTLDPIQLPKQPLLEKITTKQSTLAKATFYRPHNQAATINHNQPNIKQNLTNRTAVNSIIDAPQPPKTFRKGRFQVALPSSQPENYQQNSDRNSSPNKEEKSDSELSLRAHKKINSRMVSFQFRRREFSRTIQAINRGFLSTTDNYMALTVGEELPQAQIQLCVNSLCQPQSGNGGVRQRSITKGNLGWADYDFHFEEEHDTHKPKQLRRNKYQP